MLRALPQLVVALLLAATTATPDWFAGRTTLTMRIDAPFADLFAHAQQDDYSVRGSLTWTSGEGRQRLDHVKIAVRGNTSRRATECSFPKLKISSNGSGVKIGTHCGESEGDAVTAKYGRLANQASPFREAFVYHLLDTLGVPTLRTRRAEITYVDTDGNGDSGGRASLTTRHAFLLEENDAARERLGASRSIDETEFTSAREAFTPDDTAKIAFAEALIGNFDWCLRFYKGDAYRCDGRHPLWNLLAFEYPDGSMRPLMYDFDVSGAVAGYHRWFKDLFNEQFLASKSHAAIEVTAQLQHARTLFDRRMLDATRRAFASKRAAAYRALAGSAVDADGKRIMTEYFDTFFEAMTSDAAFYRPVVVARDTRPFADPARTQPVCSSVGTLPVGTPVSDPVQTHGDMVQVVVLDAMWKYAPPMKCPFIHRNPVWIAKSAIDTQYP